MTYSFRISNQTLKVLSYLLKNIEDEVYSLEVSSGTDLKYGTVQPILVRLEKHGWLTSDWEDIDPKEAGRSARRYYRFTDDGKLNAKQVIRETQAFLPSFGAAT